MDVCDSFCYGPARVKDNEVPRWLLEVSIRRVFREPMTWQHMQDITRVSGVTRQPAENRFSASVCSKRRGWISFALIAF